MTTVSGSSARSRALAEKIAKNLKLPLIPREEKSLEDLRKEYQISNILVATAKGPVVYTPGGEYFFHLNMTELRIKNIESGKPDHMLQAMELTKGMSVLDCTLGLAGDAVVASYFAGDSGKIVGVETSPVVYLITEYGLKKFVCKNAILTAALRRIETINLDSYSYLCTLADHSFDIVYFDPMFRQPVYSSSHLKPLRYLADMRPLSHEMLVQACRVAKRRVVIKETRRSEEFKRLGCTAFAGGRYSSIQYGIIKVGGG